MDESQDDALIEQALQIGLDLATEHLEWVKEAYAGHMPRKHEEAQKNHDTIDAALKQWQSAKVDRIVAFWSRFPTKLKEME
jgi:hypothetical protein